MNYHIYNRLAEEKTMSKLITTLGNYSDDQLGLILPHEHIFVDLGPIEEENWKHADPQAAVELMTPELNRAAEAGVTALVECTPVGVGRRVDIVKAVSDAADFPVVLPTGIYREPWVPEWAHKAPLEKIRDWMISELTNEIEGSGLQAAWIKLSAGDEGLTSVETKILRAAAQAGKETGAVIGSHTIKGRVVKNQLDIIEEEGYSAARFIWIHTQAEPDFHYHIEHASRGAWLEYDSIGGEEPGDQFFLEHIPRLLDSGFGDQLMLSQDRGWFDPSQPGGGIPKSFTYLSEIFLPKLRDYGLDEKTIHQLTHLNPFKAFSR
jgi:phosphotriesterase-related protein